MKPAPIELTQHEYGYLNALVVEKDVEASKTTPPSVDPSHLFRDGLRRKLGPLLYEGRVVIMSADQWEQLSDKIHDLSVAMDDLYEEIC